jgi:hypothetical protein
LLIFKCVFLGDELAALQNYMPPQGYCIVSVPEENICYGVISAVFHSKFMDILSGETLEHLEYLDQQELTNLIADKNVTIIGNADLLNFKGEK